MGSSFWGGVGAVLVFACFEFLSFVVERWVFLCSLSVGLHSVALK